jgi:hypothetical protein
MDVWREGYRLPILEVLNGSRKTINTSLQRRELPNIAAFRHWYLRNRHQTASNAAQMRKDDPMPIGS